jgi:predicted transcriptional regulator
MRTTVRLNDALLQEAKRYAAETNRTLTSVIEEALQEKLAKRDTSTEDKPFKLITAKGRLQPGVDLDNNAALLDVMEGRS